MAYIARTLASVGRGLVRKASTHTSVIPTASTATTVMGKCGYFSTITHHTPIITQLNTLQTRQRHSRARSRDAELADFVKNEIAHESEQSRPIPGIPGYELERGAGTLVTLTNDGRDEKITISFDVNENLNVPSEHDDEMGGAITSYPDPFSVTIEKKPSGRSLRFNCSTGNEDGMSEEEEEIDLPFHITSVQAFNAGVNADVNTIYQAETDNMDAELHDMLLDTLAERGLDVDFVHELIELSSCVEHEMHLDHLERLLDFANE